MSLLDQARSAVTDWRPPNVAQAALRGQYLTLLDVPGALFKPCHPDHLTASALVLNAARTAVLLTHHRRADAWFQFGGHLEPEDTSLAAAALREATEESGIIGLTFLVEGPVQLDVHRVDFCHPQGGVRHFDVRFLLLAPDGAEHTVSAESYDVAWWPVDALPTDEESLVELVSIAAARHS